MDEVADLLATYREIGDQLIDLVAAAFPPGCRVRPPGVTSPNWIGSVETLEGYDRKAMAADLVWVVWDNGNRYAVRVDELERV